MKSAISFATKQWQIIGNTIDDTLRSKESLSIFERGLLCLLHGLRKKKEFLLQSMFHDFAKYIDVHSLIPKSVIELCQYSEESNSKPL